MGTWGSGLFADDIALDIKNDWQELYKCFGEPEGPTRELLTLHDVDDEDQGPIVILVLAVCQWRYGCLQPSIKARALEIIWTGAGLHLWEDARHLAKRKAVYAQIAEGLERPQPPRKIIKKLKPRSVTPFKPGQLLKYRCWDGEFMLLWVTGEYRYMGDVLPMCAALDWKGATLPSRREILALRPIFSEMDAFNKKYFRDLAAKEGEELAPEPDGLDWSAYAPRGPSEHGFDIARVEVLAGEWEWNLRDHTGGPFLPHWIELGPVLARELSTTIRLRESLPKVKGRPLDCIVPARPRPLAPLSTPQRPLGIDVPLHSGRQAKWTQLRILKRSKHQPMPGDIFVVNVKGKRWVVGRVILSDAQFASSDVDVLVYFYSQTFNRTSEIMLPMRLDDLLIGPQCASKHDWETGEFLHVASVPLDPSELPARHIFGPGLQHYHIDAYGLPTPAPAEDELVGHRLIGGIDSQLAKALELRN